MNIKKMFLITKIVFN